MAGNNICLGQVHILGVGLAVHEKLVHPEMRPLHKKLTDQFLMLRSSLFHVSFTVCTTRLVLDDLIASVHSPTIFMRFL